MENRISNVVDYLLFLELFILEYVEKEIGLLVEILKKVV